MKRTLYARSELRVTTHAKKEFRRIINEIWKRKAVQLLKLLDPSFGSPPKLSRKWRDDQIDRLKTLVASMHLPPLRRWVKANTVRRSVRFGRYATKTEKAVIVRERLAKSCGRELHLVYASFAKGDKCLKVGRSDKGLNRIRNQKNHIYFCNASRVDVYFPTKRKKKTLPALECALTHLHDPVYRDSWPALIKWHEKCPACRDTMKLEDEVRRIFSA